MLESHRSTTNTREDVGDPVICYVKEHHTCACFPSPPNETIRNFE